MSTNVVFTPHLMGRKDLRKAKVPPECSSPEQVRLAVSMACRKHSKANAHAQVGAQARADTGEGPEQQ